MEFHQDPRNIPQLPPVPGGSLLRREPWRLHPRIDGFRFGARHLLLIDSVSLVTILIDTNTDHVFQEGTTMSRSRAPRAAVASAADASTPVNTESVSVTVSDIARRAFDLYLARGRQDGHDVDDWLQAERELQGDKGPAAQ